ncbi:phospholipid/cholesterol/gamma-HCH transport system ATP-binding protein [Silvibacterium bohemicum]|uniref:Phospholipid/cholesterol/gamma-HCH transport system ATP-binding protein n=1 Tax=Silvibacterium bohemicum TaxID=1577686 RepID=A0A841JY18_9BACT|nr:ATP-binding cassette domain-containing protein [Silvibacterium bohemicum]MBB6143881.1 phospholipid/cholesterol/gamma-HCH transport system ATP-binding protein [Silvibacterium bohemicum]
MNETQDTAIALDHVSKSFGKKQVLRDVSFSVARGEAICVLGRSGTGKSVTLKLMIALLKPDAGRISIDEDDITQLERKELSRVRRKMGFLFQSAALFDSLTLHDNLALPLRRLTDKSKQEIEVIIDHVLGQVGLADDKGKMPVELSGGMQKRAGLARALVFEPQILLIDEPSSGLDRITASEIDDLLLEQKTKHHTTMVIVTHDVHCARRVGDRFAVLDQGRLAALGTPQELEHHENETVRMLVGES